MSVGKSHAALDVCAHHRGPRETFPTKHREARLKRVRLVATKLPPGSHLVRVHPDDSPLYNQMTVVTVRRYGREVFLSGWIGEPLTREEWREGAAKLFPRAQLVIFERLGEDGTLRHVKLRIRPHRPVRRRLKRGAIH